MSSVTIQPKTGDNLSRPYPFHIEEDGTVGRQDFWNGTPEKLVGFQNDADVQHVDVPVREFLADPDVAVGKYPVFIDADGSMWNYAAPIESILVNA
ncbi:hypothetical protein [Aeromicrobium sp. 179-A 4D2 NHS]|uniref:hypothetical protein n=1 Tax=Aeromicrobium sp. 179-A 4D2 NHS TaxID=3142375 RepID=UPI0039A2938A